MHIQDDTNFHRISLAIDFINSNFNRQPDLEEIAKQLHLSPFHFQRLFTEWAGVSPKKFLQYLTLAHAKKMLREEQATLFTTAIETGLSGTGRLHDLFINIEGMTPGEYKQGGINLNINYSFAASPFGKILLASTEKGICYTAFAEDEISALAELKLKFPNASYQSRTDDLQQSIQHAFISSLSEIRQVKLHLKGTDFQLKVWEALLKIPAGRLSTYGTIANNMERPGASRAVGSAVGANPVAFLIPCHRVIQSTGIFGQYHWGSTRKQAMIAWEAARTDQLNEGTLI